MNKKKAEKIVAVMRQFDEKLSHNSVPHIFIANIKGRAQIAYAGFYFDSVALIASFIDAYCKKSSKTINSF